MKKFALIISVFALFAMSSCGGGTPDEIVVEKIDSNYCQCVELLFDEPYNHFYRFDRTEYFEGRCEDFYPNGQLKLEKTIVKGKNHGLQKKYFEDGQLAEVREFDMNFQIGVQINYTREGDTAYYATYERGELKDILKITPNIETVQ
ncbi:MAG: hypothetical protein MK078_07040 [Crocinitomicaceae bacterium]|nr:hypothetical protein [Crocinitomicaceae bacterium]